MFRKVVIMLIAPRIEEAPDRWTAKMAKSMDMPPSFTDRGGFKTQPTPEPPWPFPPGMTTDRTAIVVPATYIQ